MRRRRRVDVVYRLALFVLPFAIAFTYVATLLALLSFEAWGVVLGGMAGYLFAPVGTEVVIPVVVIGLQAIGAAPHEIVLGVASVVMVDVLAALFVAWNWDLVERIPRLGPWVLRVEERCRQVIERRRWGEGATLAALAAYVALPVQMTGGLFGSVLGRVMGVEKLRVFVAVTAGSLAGAVPMAIVAVVVGEPLLDALRSSTFQTLALAAGILITVAFLVAVVLLYRRGKAHAD